MENYDTVRTDFNEISQLDEPIWNHNNHYFKYLLKFLPANPDFCLDIGCGKGELSFMLSKKSKKVIAVDLADKMIKKAKQLHPAKNIDYICDNILNMNFGDDSLDAIITSATAHHLPFDWLINFAEEKLRPGGKLIIMDIYKAQALSDYILCSLAFFPRIIMNLIYNGSLRKDTAKSKELWKNHSRHDTYMTVKDIKKHVKKYLPKAKVKRKLFFRYILLWKK